MIAYKVSFTQHYQGRKVHWVDIVIAETEEQAKEFAQRDLVSKVPGFAHQSGIKKLADIKPGKPIYLWSEAFDITGSLDSLKEYHVQEELSRQKRAAGCRCEGTTGCVQQTDDPAKA